MLARADLDYAFAAAEGWAEDELDTTIDEDEVKHFAYYFSNVCDETGTLDNNIPSVFRVWRAEILPSLR